MIRAMRILCLNEEESFFFTNSLSMVSIRNEGQVFETLLTLINERIETLAATIEANVRIFHYKSPFFMRYPPLLSHLIPLS